MKKENVKMEIEKDIAKSPTTASNNNLIHMEEENESIKKNNSKFQATKTSSELNCSLATNYSLNSKNTDKSLNIINQSNNYIIPKIEPIFKINIGENNSKYLYNLEYIDEIYQNLLQEEKNANLKIEKNYMKQQNDINDKMRAILVDWLIEVHRRFRLKRKTLFQTIYIIDLYLSQKIIQKSRLQLLGIASLLISCKQNEIFYPPILEFLYITNNAYNKEELLGMEMLVLQTLNFEILSATSEEFYNIISKAFNFNKKQHLLGEYFLDSSLLDYNILKYKASVVGAACAYFVMKFFGIKGYKDLYSPRIIMEEFPQKKIKECTKNLCFLVKNLSNSYLRATQEKYSSEEFGNVAALCEEQKI